MEKTKLGISENIEAMLAYSFPPLAAITGFMLLIFETESKFVRFHSMQSFLVFAFYGVATFILGMIPFLGGMLAGIMGIIAMISWALLIINAFRGKYYRFPFVGQAVYEKIVGGEE